MIYLLFIFYLFVIFAKIVQGHKTVARIFLLRS